MKNIVVLVSGGGTNLQALIDAQKAGKIVGGAITCVISSNPNAYALERAAKAGIKSVVVSGKEFPTKELYAEKLLEILAEEKADLIVLAGFMKILDISVTSAYENKIINVHPALIPSFCGVGFYGLRVHEAALEYGVKVSGATVHFVNENADEGAIIMQGTVAIENDETAESLQKKIMENVEWKILPETVSLFCQDKIVVQDGKAKILD